MEEKDSMKKKEKRPTYEPPKALDLSDSSVSGQQICQDGSGFNGPGCTAGNADALECGQGGEFGGSQ